VPDRFGEPVTIGEVTISSGDYLIGDRDGIVIIPGAIAAEVVTKTEEVMQTENKVRTAILSGMDPQEAYLKFGKF
jgi:regulator of RNase E activity RraA